MNDKFLDEYSTTENRDDMEDDLEELLEFIYSGAGFLHTGPSVSGFVKKYGSGCEEDLEELCEEYFMDG